MKVLESNTVKCRGSVCCVLNSIFDSGKDYFHFHAQTELENKNKRNKQARR